MSEALFDSAFSTPSPGPERRPTFKIPGKLRIFSSERGWVFTTPFRFAPKSFIFNLTFLKKSTWKIGILHKRLFAGVRKLQKKLPRLGTCEHTWGTCAKPWRIDHLRSKNYPLITYKHLMTWPPLSWIFFGPRATFHTWHVWCYSKKPRSLIKAKVEVSLFFWKHSLRGVVRMTYLHHFKSEFKFQSWFRRVDEFIIDHTEV